MRNKAWVIFFFAALLATALASGCSRGSPEGLKGTVTAAGSTALLPLAKQAAELFMSTNPGVTVNVSGGGSFTGLTQVAAGSVDIGNSDVPATPELAGQGLVDHQVAVAPFVIITHPGVGVDSLSREQLAGIFTGSITNWKEVGGPDLAITIIHRAKSSGSRATISEIVLGGRDFTDRAVILNSNGEVRQGVATNPGAIGYVDAAYLNETVKAIAYNGVPYSPENVIAGRYPVYAYEHMYTRGEARGAVKAFLDFVLSPEFQGKYVEKLGFIPITRLKKG